MLSNFQQLLSHCWPKSYQRSWKPSNFEIPEISVVSLSQESNNNNKTAQSCEFNVAHLCHVKDASVIARARKWERNALNSNKNEWTQRQRRYIDKNPLLSVVVLVVEEEW